MFLHGLRNGMEFAPLNPRRNIPMTIAVPVWESRVSPVLDTADRLLVLETREGAITSRTEVYIGGVSLPEKARIIRRHAPVLICAALSQTMENYLLSAGLKVYPWVMGNAEILAEIYACGKVPGPEFFMPGCGRKQYGGCVHRSRQRKQHRAGKFNKPF